MAAALTFLSVAAPNGIFVAATLASDDNQATAHTADDALTRESMADLGRPGSTPPPSGPMTPIPPTRSRVNSKVHAKTRSQVDPKDFTPHRHQVRHREPKREQPQIVIQKKVHRNPAASFVFWWNGWVIRNFHTKFGTVLLGTVGAKT